MENKENIGNDNHMSHNENTEIKKSRPSRWFLLILTAGLILLIIGASLLYDRLDDSYKNNQLIIQGGADTSVPTPTDETSTDETTPSESTTDSAEQERIMAPDFTVYDADGNPIHLSDFIGKPIILNFWASWCDPCKSEMPDFDEAFAEYGEAVHFAMINCTDGSRETVDSAQSFIDGQGYRFPVYFDTASEAAYTYGASAIPMTFFIDAEGYLVAYWPGALDGELLQVGIDLIYQPEG